jgi:putative chitinase
VQDPVSFFATVRDGVFSGTLDQDQVDGLNFLTDTFTTYLVSDVRYQAYMLATAWWETAHTMQPIAEIGHGAGKPYGVPTGPYEEIYYGRGYPQTTWLTNYEKMDTLLHTKNVLPTSQSLVATPDLMLTPSVAAPAMIFGMQLGLFTGKKLADYFNSTISDWVNARRIINALDHAQDIANAAKVFYSALRGLAPTS